MKNEKELKNYLEECKKQLIIEEKRESYYMVIVAKTIISTIMWVLEEEPQIDLNRIIKQ